MLDLLTQILDQFDLRQAEVINCHFSLKDVQVDITEAHQAANLLLERLGRKCTLIVPVFPFAPFGENAHNYATYVSKPIVYDVVKTPCYISLFGEVFRRMPNVRRSLNPLYPIAALGPLAEELLQDTELDGLPFADRTCYGKLVNYRSFGLGLGLDINTNPFIHLIDRLYADQLPYSMYSEEPLIAEIRKSGKLIDRRSYYFVPPDFRKKIRPRNLRILLEKRDYCKMLDAPAYWLELKPFVEEGLKLAASSLAKNGVPPWHQGGKLEA